MVQTICLLNVYLQGFGYGREEGSLQPDAVVGVPVGFVGQQNQAQTTRSSILLRHWAKKGVCIAAAVINAILYQLKLGATGYERYSVSG